MRARSALIEICRLLTFVAVVFVLTTRWAGAADKEGVFTVIGDGNGSCGRWMNDRGTEFQHADKSWVLGFISAYNDYEWVGKDVTNGIDNEGLFAWIDSYCRANPLEHVSKAVTRLLGHLATHNSILIPKRPK